MLSVAEAIEFLEQTQKSDKPQSITLAFKETLTNISYAIKNSQFISVPFITRKTIRIDQNQYGMAHLLGKSYSYQNKNEFQQKFATTIWMTYRKLHDSGDVGWGCMIRVVQMIFAEVLKRATEKNPYEIIPLFKQQTKGPLAFSRICQAGYIKQRFTSSPQIYAIITSLLQQSKHQLNLNLTIENFCHTIKIKAEKQYPAEQFPKLISVLAKAGDNEYFSQEYLAHLLVMIKDSSFCGIAAGIQNEALFVVGQYKQIGIILDPHYVQSNQKQQTYFERVPKGVKFTELKSTFTINFYFKTIQSFGMWIDNVLLMQKVMNPNLCFKIDVKNQEQWIQNHRKKSGDFELLS